MGEGVENQGRGGREGGWGGEENFQRRTRGKRSPTGGRIDRRRGKRLPTGGEDRSPTGEEIADAGGEEIVGGGGGGGVGTADGGRRRRGSDLQQMGWLPSTILPFLTLFIAISSDL